HTPAAQSSASGHLGGEHAAGHITSQRAAGSARGCVAARARARVSTRVRRAFTRAQSHRERVPPGARAVAYFHVLGAGGAVRIMAPSGHHPAVASADTALRAHFHPDFRPITEHLLRTRDARAFRRREEELNFAV